jgi:hypothetical protein
VAGEIPASSSDGVKRGSCGEGLGLLGTDLDRRWELRWPVAERAAAPSGGIRSGPSSGMGCGEGVQLVVVVVRVGASEGPECVVRR